MGLRGLLAGLGQDVSTVFPYQPSTAEVALAQAWIASNGYGSALTPWNLDTSKLSFTVPTTGGGGSVVFGFGRGVFASIAAPQGSWISRAGRHRRPRRRRRHRERPRRRRRWRGSVRRRFCWLVGPWPCGTSSFGRRAGSKCPTPICRPMR